MADRQITIIVAGRDANASATLDRVNQGVKTLGQSAQATKGSVGGLHAALGQMLMVAGGVSAAFVGMNVIAAPFQAAKSIIIDFNARIEQARIAFTTMLGSAGQANAFLQELAKFAAKTPFEFPELVKSAQRMLGLGFASQEVLPMINAIGNAVASIGGGAEIINRVTLAIGQMQMKGRVMGEELRQLAEAGIPAYRILAEALGKSTQEIMKLTEKGQISSDIFKQAFMAFAGQEWGQMMAQQARTFSGAMTTIKDSLMMAGAQALEPLFRRLSDLAVRMAEFVSADSFGDWAAGIAARVEIALQALGILADGFRTAMQSILTVVTTAGRMIYEALSYLNPFASHSPSLVDQVDKGTQQILEAYQKLGREIPAELANLVTQQTALNAAIAAQEATITAAERAMKPLQNALRDAQEHLSDLRTRLSEAQADLQKFLTTPLKGSKAFSDALFANSQAAKAVQKQLLQMQLGPKFPGMNRAMFALEKQLGRLQKEGQLVQLDEGLQLDPLRRKLQQAADDTEELTFEEAMKGVLKAKSAIKTLEPQIESVEKRIKSLQDQIESRMGAIEGMRDQLAGLREAYAAVADKVGEWKEKLQDAMGAAKGAAGLGLEAPAGFKPPSPMDWGKWRQQVESDLTGVDAALWKLNAAAGLEDFKTKMAELVKPFQDLAGAALAFDERLRGADTAVAGLQTNMAGITGPIQGLLGLVGVAALRLGELATALSGPLSSALRTVVGIWSVTFLPVLQGVVGFLTQHVFPALGSLANVWLKLVGKEIEILTGLWQNILQPALALVAGYIAVTFGPQLVWLRDNVMVPLGKAFENAGLAIDKVKGYLDTLAGRIESIKLPWWLTPGSATPFEEGLWGISEALGAVSMETFVDELDLLGQKVEATYTKIETDTRTKWDNIKRVIVNAMESARSAATSKALQMQAALSSAFYNIQVSASANSAEMRDNFNGALQAMINKIREPGGILDAIKELIDWLNAIPTTIYIDVYYREHNVPKNPPMQTGGYVHNTGLTLLHKGEYVVPASTVHQMLKAPAIPAYVTPVKFAGAAVSGMGNVTINGPLIGTATIRSDQDIVDLAYRVASEIQRRR